MLVTISQSFAGSFFLKTDTSRQKTKVAIKEFNEIWHTCWAMGETEKSQILDIFDLWSSSCEIMKFCRLEVIQILKMAVTFLFLKTFT
jgi:hypothetical protein